MKIRLIEQPTGQLNGKAWPAAGEVVEIHGAVAADMVRAGMAEPVEPDDAHEDD